MKAALYCRVSTDEQAREGYSIPAQIKALKEYCKKNNIDVFRTYTDEGQPGSKEDRPKFQNMLKDAGMKKFDLILVHKFDRFARKVELSQRVKNNLRKTGINVISITEPIEDSPIGFFQEGMLELLSEYYIKNLAMEVKKGQREKVSQGKVVNMLPYGYKNIKGEAVIVPNQSEVIQKIFSMYNEGYGSHKISEYLNDMQIPTHKSGLWNSGRVNYILRNVAYTGAIKWAGKVYDDKMPIIIDKNLFELTQSKINVKLKSNRSFYYNEFLLLGLLKCGTCGAPMRISKMHANGNSNGKTYYMYTCRQARYSKMRCPNTKLYQHKLVEEMFANYMMEILRGSLIPQNIEHAEIKTLELHMVKLERELERAKNAYYAEVFTIEEFKSETRRIKDAMSMLSFEKTKEQQQKKSMGKIKSQWHRFNELKTVQEKKAALNEFIKRIMIIEDSCVTRMIVDFYA
jgi:site-specific DNA recombinase